MKVVILIILNIIKNCVDVADVNVQILKLYVTKNKEYTYIFVADIINCHNRLPKIFAYFFC